MSWQTASTEPLKTLRTGYRPVTRAGIHACARVARLTLLLLLGLSPAAVAADAGLKTALNPHWRLVTDRDGIQVYMRHGKHSRLKTFRGVMRVAHDDEYTAAAIINDYASYPKWLHFVDAAREIARDNVMQRYLHFTTYLPWPLTDREAVLQAEAVEVITPDEESITIYLRNRPELIPPDDAYIRFPQLQGMLKATRLGNNKAELVYQLILDPGGYIPDWLANIVLRDAPYFTLKRLRRQMQTGEYRGTFFDYLELRGPGRPATLAPARSYLYGHPPSRPYPNGVPMEEKNPPVPRTQLPHRGR